VKYRINMTVSDILPLELVSEIQNKYDSKWYITIRTSQWNTE
jgi:hypothetical protein